MRSHIKTTCLTITTLALPAMLLAATTAPAKENSYSAVVIGLVSLIVILLFSILVLANILRQVGFVYRDKLRDERKGNSGTTKNITMLAALLLTSSNYVLAQSTATPTSSSSIAGMSTFDFYLLMGVIGIELLVILALSFQLRKIVKLISKAPVVEHSKLPKFKLSIWDRMNAAVAVEKEEDILLDHDYDGIKELDNSLPPWWIYGFYLTIVVAVIYMWHYHVGGSGPSSYDEYVAEVQEGEASKAAYLAKSSNMVDENTVVMLDDAGIAAGAMLYQNMCAACHTADGGGSVGPNLTDDYWLHGGSVKDIFKTIKYGWPDKGMKSWKDDFSPRQIAEITSFVKSLRGTKPAAPKEKQGELYIESEEVADSTSKVAAQ